MTAVLFDMDGTLVDSEGLHGDATRRLLDELGYGFPEDLGDRMTGMSVAECHALLVRELRFALSLAAFIEAKYRNYLAGAARLQRRKGVDDVLSLLAGTPMAVVSNSDRMLVDANLAAAKLAKPGLVTVSRNDVLRGKPDAEPYLRAAYLLGVSPGDCIVVEDSVPGAIAGLAAGMTVIGWPEPHRTDLVFPAGTIAADPQDLVTVLAGLLAAPNTLKDARHVSR